MAQSKGPGRPPRDVAGQRIQLTLSLREGEDDDLIPSPAAAGRDRAAGGKSPVMDEAELPTMLDGLIFQPLFGGIVGMKKSEGHFIHEIIGGGDAPKRGKRWPNQL